MGWNLCRNHRSEERSLELKCAPTERCDHKNTQSKDMREKAKEMKRIKKTKPCDRISFGASVCHLKPSNAMQTDRQTPNTGECVYREREAIKK